MRTTLVEGRSVVRMDYPLTSGKLLRGFKLFVFNFSIPFPSRCGALMSKGTPLIPPNSDPNIDHVTITAFTPPQLQLPLNPSVVGTYIHFGLVQAGLDEQRMN